MADAIQFRNIPQNLRVPLFWAEIDPSQANSNQQTQRSLLIGQITPSGAAGLSTGGALAVQLATGAATSSGSTLTFASVPASIVPGMVVEDLTTTGRIAAGTTVVSTTSNTVVLAAAVTGAGVLSGDVIRFSQPVTAYLVNSLNLARQMFGQGSQLARMFDAYRQSDPFGEVWCLPILDDPAAVAATGTITIAGAPTANGTIALYVDGISVPVLVTTTMTSAQIATAIASAINALTTSQITPAYDLPVTANATSSVVTVTAKNKGLCGNDIDFRINYRGVQGGEVTPAGLTITLSPLTGAASGAATLGGGTTNPATFLANALAQPVMGIRTYDFVGHPYSDANCLNAIQSWLGDASGHWSWVYELFGGGFGAVRGTVASLQTFGTGRNDQHNSMIGYWDSPSSTATWAAAYCGACAQSLRADPALPLHDLPMPAVLPPPSVSRFVTSDQNTLLWDGISTFQVDQGGNVMTQLAITTYQTNSFGMPDDSYLKVETLFTLAYILRYLKTRITTKFARVKLADDGTRIGNNTVTPSVIKSEIVAAYGDLETMGLVQDTAVFAKAVDVERNPTNPNRVDCLWPGTLIDQLDVFALLAQFRR